MQKILTMLFLSIFLFSFFEGKTQTSFPFPTENAVWTEVQHIFPGNTITVHYGIIGDTIMKIYLITELLKHKTTKHFLCQDFLLDVQNI